MMLIEELSRSSKRNPTSWKCFGPILFALCLVFPTAVSALPKTSEIAGKQESNAASAAAPVAPEQVSTTLADIIPLASALSSRLVVLEKNVSSTLDVVPLQKRYESIRAKLSEFSKQLRELQSNKSISYASYLKMSERLEAEEVEYVELSKPLIDAIGRLDQWKQDWKKEAKLWSTLRAEFLDNQSSQYLNATFSDADVTIDKAQTVISNQIEELLHTQVVGAQVEGDIDTLLLEVRSLIAASRIDFIHGKSLPMYSPHYFGQFKDELWSYTWHRVQPLKVIDNPFFKRHASMFFLTFLFFLATVSVVYRSRQLPKRSDSWQFVAERPISTGVFVYGVVSILQLRYLDAPSNVLLLALTISVIAFFRISGVLLKEFWKRQAAQGVAISFLLMMIVEMLGIPEPLSRLYVFTTSLLAIIFCSRWRKASAEHKQSSIFRIVFNSVSLVAFIVVVSQFLGDVGSAAYLFQASLFTLAIILSITLMVYISQGAIRWIFSSPTLWQFKLLRNEVEDNVRRISVILTVVLLYFTLPSVLKAWGLYDTYFDAVSSFALIGFTVGGVNVNIGLLLTAFVTLYTTLLVSSVLPKIILDDSIAGSDLDRGAKVSIDQLLKYFIILIGFLCLLLFFGFDWTKLTIVLSALGIGIGFGLQSIVNNFVSGLILLFERPIRDGDTIEFENDRVHIKKIGLRATHVQTFDSADKIIPNADLITHPVTNWTLSNRQERLSLPVGVAYGSDVKVVEETLSACAQANESVVKSPEPQVLFMNFGDSALTFELRVWVKDADDRVFVRSQLYNSILQKFRELNIEIPFPQRDIHVRSTPNGGAPAVSDPAQESNDKESTTPDAV